MEVDSFHNLFSYPFLDFAFYWQSQNYYKHISVIEHFVEFFKLC